MVTFETELERMKHINMFLSACGIVYERLSSLKRPDAGVDTRVEHILQHARAHANLITGRAAAACCGTAATVCVCDGATNLRRTAAKVTTLLRLFV